MPKLCRQTRWTFEQLTWFFENNGSWAQEVAEKKKSLRKIEIVETDSFGGGESVRIFGPTAPKELCIAQLEKTGLHWGQTGFLMLYFCWQANVTRKDTQVNV